MKQVIDNDTQFLGPAAAIVTEAGWSRKPQTLDRLRRQVASIRAKEGTARSGERLPTRGKRLGRRLKSLRQGK